MNENEYSVVFDFDGTLGRNAFSDLQYGEEYNILPFGEKVKRIANSGYYESAKKIMNNLIKEYTVYIVTGRSEELRDISERWLNRYGFNYDELVMMDEQWKRVSEYFQFKVDAVDVIKPLIVIDDSSTFLGKVAEFSMKSRVMIATFLIKDEESWNYNNILNKINMVKRNRCIK